MKDFTYWRSQIDEIYFDTLKMVHPGKDIEAAIKKAFADLLAQPERMERATASDFKRLVNAWLSNEQAQEKRIKLL